MKDRIQVFELRRDEDMIDHCSYLHSLSSCENKAWKKRWVRIPFKPFFFSGFFRLFFSVVLITAMINHVFISTLCVKKVIRYRKNTVVRTEAKTFFNFKFL